MSHTRECEKNGKAADAARQAWIKRWPHFCTACDGWGGHHDPGNRETPPDFDLCQTCQDAEEIKCPRCGALNETWSYQNEIEQPCSKCDWDIHNPDGAPPGWECWGYCEDEENTHG